jgi:signal transduction histidine kinase
VVESAIPILQHQLNKKDIKLDVSIPKDIKVYIDENTFIHSVLNNLLTNAIKFSYPSSTIFLSACKEDGKILFSIRDNGIGMSKNLLNNIFDLNKPTSRPGTAGENGTGYGMPLVKKFVELFGGTIEIKSKEKPDPSSGTEVILTLKEK